MGWVGGEGCDARGACRWPGERGWNGGFLFERDARYPSTRAHTQTCTPTPSHAPCLLQRDTVEIKQQRRELKIQMERIQAKLEDRIEALREEAAAAEAERDDLAARLRVESKARLQAESQVDQLQVSHHALFVCLFVFFCFFVLFCFVCVGCCVDSFAPPPFCDVYPLSSPSATHAQYAQGEADRTDKTMLARVSDLQLQLADLRAQNEDLDSASKYV